MRLGDVCTAVKFNDRSSPSITKSDDVEVDVLTGQRGNRMDGPDERPRPRGEVAQRTISQQGGDGNTDAGPHHQGVG